MQLYLRILCEPVYPRCDSVKSSCCCCADVGVFFTCWLQFRRFVVFGLDRHALCHVSRSSSSKNCDFVIEYSVSDGIRTCSMPLHPQFCVRQRLVTGCPSNAAQQQQQQVLLCVCVGCCCCLLPTPLTAWCLYPGLVVVKRQRKWLAQFFVFRRQRLPVSVGFRGFLTCMYQVGIIGVGDRKTDPYTESVSGFDSFWQPKKLEKTATII